MTKKEIAENIKLMKELEKQMEGHTAKIKTMKKQLDESNKMKSELVKRFPALLLKPSI